MYKRLFDTTLLIIFTFISIVTILIIIPLGNFFGVPKIRQLLITSETTSDEVIRPWEF